MKRWNSFIEILKFPLMILIIAVFLRGVSSTLLSPNLARTIIFQQDFIYIVAEVINYFSEIIIVNFPLIVLLVYLTKQNNSAAAAGIGFLAYILFNTLTMFFAPQTLPATAYGSLFGMQIDARLLHISGYEIQMPLQTGIVGPLLIGLISRFHFKRSRSRSAYGFLPFIDQDTWAYISTLISTAIVAVVVAFTWGHIINGLQTIFLFIAQDISNPVNVFLYGILDRLLAIANLSELIRVPFWYGELGGSWMNPAGQVFFGDVAVWTAQSTEGIFGMGSGRFITPYYVINLFAFPAIAIVIYKKFTDKLERRRYLLFLVFAIVFFIISGNMLPIEILLLFIAPLFFVFHILITGILFAIMQAIPVHIGYNYAGSVVAASPGGIFDLLAFIRDPIIQRYLFLVIVIGIFVFVLYFLFGWFYYSYGALDMLKTGLKEKRVSMFLDSVGGIKNIRSINSSPSKIIVQVHDSLLLDFSRISASGAYKIIETRAGYSIFYGPSSTIIKKEINKMLIEREKALEIRKQAQ